MLQRVATVVRPPATDEPRTDETDPLLGLASPLGGLIGQVIPLESQPGDPPFPVSVATLGDVTQVLPEVRRATGGVSTRNQLDGAGGDVDPDRALTVSLAEALERYSSCVYDPRQFTWATAAELGRGVSLATGRLCWVPAVLTYLHIPAQSAGERFSLPISTGCAAHRTPVEAVRNALCEVVERDAISLTWLQRFALPKIELDMVDVNLAGFLELAAERNSTVHLFDATTDIGIPTVYSLDVSRDHPTCTTVVMCATDLDPRRAVAKVLREAASARIALSVDRSTSANPDDFITAYDGAAYMGRPEHLPAFGFLLDSPDRRRLSELPVLATGDPGADLRLLLGRLDRLGFEAFAVDLTTDEARRVGMHVVRVIVPGLQPLSFSHRARYLAHPRLYDAPAALGYPVHTEADINPWPQPFA